MDPVDPKELELEEQELDAARFLPFFATDFFAAVFGILLRGFFSFLGSGVFATPENNCSLVFRHCGQFCDQKVAQIPPYHAIKRTYPCKNTKKTSRFRFFGTRGLPATRAKKPKTRRFFRVFRYMNK